MIDYEEELKKFEPCLDVADAEGAIYDRELTDILDILQEVLREAKSGRQTELGTFQRPQTGDVCKNCREMTYEPNFHCRRQSGMNFGSVTENGVNSN